MNYDRFNVEFHSCFDNYVKTFEFEEKILKSYKKKEKNIEKYFMHNKYPLNTSFSTYMLVNDFGIEKVDFIRNVRPILRSEAIEKIRMRYDGIELDRTKLPAKIDYKLLEVFFNTN